MNMPSVSLVSCVAFVLATSVTAAILAGETSSGEGSGTTQGEKEAKRVAKALDFKVKDVDGKEVALSTYQGKVLLVVNVASRCGLTKAQYAGLEPLYKKYKERGFEILAFPANDFLGQEPGTDSEIKAFCASKGVSFKLFSKISVKGSDIHPFYKYLTSPETGGKFAGDITWNFEKFLFDAEGKVVARFAPRVDPLSKEVTGAVEKALAGVKPAGQP